MILVFLGQENRRPDQALRQFRNGIATEVLLGSGSKSFGAIAAMTACICGVALAAGIPHELGERRGWNVVLSDACTDTLVASMPEVMDSAQRCLKADDWRIQSANSKSGEIITGWKPMKHPLARILLGHIEGKCVVNAAPLALDSTIVVFQGAISSHEELEDNPSLRIAMHAYRDAAHNWQKAVRSDIVFWRKFHPQKQ